MIWKDIKGYEGLYQVSDSGEIRSLTRTDTLGRIRKGRLLKQQLDSNGYARVFLIKNGKGKRCKRHRVVAENFIPNPEYKKEVNHKNGIKNDNRVSNLEWCTPKENTNHAWRNGLVKRKRGEDCSNSKLKNKDIPVIRDMISKGVSLTNIAKKYNVATTTISEIKQNRAWNKI